jgi:hypothetical protein
MVSSSRRDRMTVASAPLLSVRGLVKRFSGVMALQGANFEVRAGEAHRQGGGEILWRGEIAEFRDPAELSTMGFARQAEARRRQVGNGRMGSHLPWADPWRGWDFVSTGRGNGPVRRCTTRCSARAAEGPAGVG